MQMYHVRTIVAVAAAAALALPASTVVMDGAGLLQTAAPCTSEPYAPAPPTNVRILSALNSDLVAAPFGPNAGPEDDALVAAAASDNPHDYFDTLASRSDCQVAYSLRAEGQIAKYRYGGYPVKVTYDASMDAARWQWNYNDTSAENLRLPIRLDRPASGTSKLLIVSDHRWDSAWLTEYKDPAGNPIGGWKWMQVTSMTGPGSTRSRIWFEPQMRWIGDMHNVNAIVGTTRTQPFLGANPMPLSSFSAREYLGPVAPTTNDGASACGIPYGGDTLATIANCFAAYPNTWTRTWIELKATAGQDYTEISWWMADENQNAVPILLNARQISYPPHTEFWFEYNTSAEARVGGPMTAWGRNVVVLKDVADPTALFQRPTP